LLYASYGGIAVTEVKSIVTSTRLVFALCSLFILMRPALADINYTLTAGTDTITFSLPQMPTVQTTCTYPDGFCITPVTLVVDGNTITGGTVAFYSPADDGGLTIQDGSTLLVNNDGPSNEQLFTGTLANPTLGTYTNLQLVSTSAGAPVYEEAFTLNAVATAPEAGSYASYAALILGLAGVTRLVKSQRARQRE
jgi:hypothetical protein